MRTYIATLVVVLLMINTLSGQVKIGDNPQNLNAASILELESSSRVLVITRVSDAEMNSISPLRGALVYNTDHDCIHYYDGSQWINICEEFDNTFTVSTRADYLSQLNPNALDSTVVITPTTNLDGSTNYNFEVNQITGANIVNSSINADTKIQAASVTGRLLAAKSVSTAKFEDGNNIGEIFRWNGSQWTLTNETALTITEKDSIVGNEVVGPRVGGSLELFGTGLDSDPLTLDVLDGGIGNTELANDAVTTDKIFNGTIITEDMADNAITIAKMADSSVGTAELVDDSVNADKINANVAGTGLVQAGDGSLQVDVTQFTGDGTLSSTDGTILISGTPTNSLFEDVQVDVANDAITSTKILDGTIATSDLADDAVTSAKIADGEIVDADVNAAAAIQGTKISPDFGTQNVATTGTLASGNATITGTLSTTSTATIGANTITATDGISGQVLTTDGAGNATWQNTGAVAVQTTSAIDGDGLALTPLDLADDAVTSAKIANDAIVDADVNAAAAIQGTKINPDFGVQNVATTGTLASGNTTITGTLSTTSNTFIGGSLSLPIRTDSGLTVIISDSDYSVIVDSATDIDLPTANAGNFGRIYIIKNLTGGVISMSSDSFIPSDSTISTQIIDLGITQLQSDGTNWQQIN